MCHYISLILSNPAKEEIYAHTLDTRNRKLETYQNPHLAKSLKAGEFLAHPQGKVCDCETALGSFHKHQPHRISLNEINKLRKRGWTETKIKRWLQEKEKINAREERIQKPFKEYLETGEPDPDGWLITISQLLEESGAKYVGLLLHWYSGSLQNERISLSSRKKVRIAENAGPELYKMEEDKIYEVYR